MIEKTLERIRAAEADAATSIREAEKEAREKVSAFRRECAEDWEAQLASAAASEQKTVAKMEEKAARHAKKLKADSGDALQSLEKASARTPEVASRIADHFLSR